ncbi:MAG: 3-oxoacyl-ACP reductase family protein [Bacillota bacterium]
MKTVLISGATGGIGQATIEKLVNDGFIVVGLYNANHEKAKLLEKKWGVDMYSLDLGLAENIIQTVKKVIDKYGKIDVLINNAGISQQKLFTDVTDCDLSNMLNVNLKGAMLLTRAVIPSMVSQKYGRIINISSVWGVSGGACEAHYSASKAGLIGFTKALSRELGPSNITVNCVAPGLIDTDMNSDISQEEKKEFAMQTSLQKTGSADDVACLVGFLAGDGAKYITGQVVGVDGGL